MHAQLKDKLYADVEGTCSGRFGYIITVVALLNISKGKVLPGTGLAEFKVKYQAIVFKPYKGEVVDAVVTTVNKVRVYHGSCHDDRSNPFICLDGFLCRCWTIASFRIEPCKYFMWRYQAIGWKHRESEEPMEEMMADMVSFFSLSSLFQMTCNMIQMAILHVIHLKIR